MSSFLGFAVVTAVIIAIPGPSVLFTISRALTMGRRVALLNVVGNALGVYLQVAAVSFGIGAVVERSLLAFTLVKYLGAAYICYLGVQAIRHRHFIAAAPSQQTAPLSTRRALRDGLAVGATNPKTIVVFVAVMPGFAVPTAGHLPLQLLALGTLFPLIALVLDSAWAIATGAIRAWLLRRPQRLAAIGGTGGLVMIGIGVTVALTGRRD